MRPFLDERMLGDEAEQNHEELDGVIAWEGSRKIRRTRPRYARITPLGESPQTPNQDSEQTRNQEPAASNQNRETGETHRNPR